MCFALLGALVYRVGGPATLSRPHEEFRRRGGLGTTWKGTAAAADSEHGGSGITFSAVRALCRVPEVQYQTNHTDQSRRSPDTMRTLHTQNHEKFNQPTNRQNGSLLSLRAFAVGYRDQDNVIPKAARKGRCFTAPASVTSKLSKSQHKNASFFCCASLVNIRVPHVGRNTHIFPNGKLFSYFLGGW